MKSITLALTVSLLISCVLDTVNARLDAGRSITLPGVGDQVSKGFGKNSYSEQICTANSYTQHRLADPCIAFCSGSTIKDKPPTEFPLPDGTPCSLGGASKICKDGTCGTPDDANARYLGFLDEYIDKSETLKGLDPKLIAAIKAELHKLKPKKAGEVNDYIEKLVNSFSGASTKYPGVFNSFKPTHK